MTKDEAIKRLKEIQENEDQEQAHVDADGVLCELLQTLGFGDVVEEYNHIAKWYA